MIIPNLKDFSLDLVNAVVIFNNQIKQHDILPLLKSIPKDWETLFSGNPELNSLGGFETPDNFTIPIAVYSDSQKGLTLTLGSNRIEIAFKIADGSGWALEDCVLFAKDRIGEIWEHLVQRNVVISRFAVITVAYAIVDDPATMLVEKFCNEAAKTGPLKRAESFEIHSHKVFEAQCGKLNSWVRNKAMVRGNGREKVVVVEQDMNTVFDGEAKTKEEMLQFFQGVAHELRSCLAVYYPE